MTLEEIKKQAELAKQVDALTVLTVNGGVDQLGHGDWQFTNEIRLDVNNHRLTKFFVEAVNEYADKILAVVKEKNRDDFLAAKVAYKAELAKLDKEVDEI